VPVKPAISGVPLGFFILLTFTVAIFSIVAALLVGLLGALLFIVFAVGVALVFLLPTLFFTTLLATFLFLWGVGAYYLLKWFSEKKVPGIHTGFAEGIRAEFLGGFDDSAGTNLKALHDQHSHPQEQDTAQTTQAQPNGDAKVERRSAAGGNPVEGVANTATGVVDNTPVGGVVDNTPVGGVKNTATGTVQNTTRGLGIPKLPKHGDLTKGTVPGGVLGGVVS